MAETQTPTAKKQQTYEAMFLFGGAAAQDAEGAIRTARGMIERHGGQILVIKKWDERKLAYEVNGQKRGTYIIAYFTAPGAGVTAIERDVKLSEDVLRIMIVKADHLNQEEMAAVEPQPIEKRDERPPWERDRPSWGDRGGDRYERGGGGGDRYERGDRPPRDDRGGADREGGPAAPAAAGTGGPAGDRPPRDDRGGADRPRPPRAAPRRDEPAKPEAEAPAAGGKE
jgi:small subunit ribosomal protein S6